MAWCLFFALVGLAGLACGCECGMSHVVDVDAGADARVDRDVGLDAPDLGTPMQPCTASGHPGAHCRSGLCASGAMCLDLTGMATDVQTTFGLRQAGVDDPVHPGYRLPDDAVDPLALAPFNAAEGTLCAEQCDAAGAIDTCGTCTTCSVALTQMPIIAAFGGVRVLLGARATFGASTGVCRIDCTWSPTSRSVECPDDTMACDTASAVCIEACTADNECNTTYAFTYAGELVTVLDTAHPRHCDAATGRCEATGRLGARVGDPCTSEDDCAPSAGVCLEGGLCGEYACPSPGTITSSCASGRGVCLQTSVASHTQSLCLLGCDVASDCGAGNTCALFGTGVTVGGHAGYCIGVCTSDDACSATETCTDTTLVDAMGNTTTQPGRCVPRCTGVGGIGASSGGCADTEVCVADHTGATYGQCEAADHFCGPPDTRSLPAASPDCATGWVCDELLAGVAGQHDSVADGHCTPACAGDADCSGHGACVTSGSLAGLCRVACASASDCAAPNVCDTALGWCVEAPPPVP